MTNLELYNYSKSHLEDKHDDFYVKNVVVIPEKSRQKNCLVENNEKLIKLITAFSQLMELKAKAQIETIEEIIEKVINILDNTEHINYSSFVQYFMVRNSNYSLYKKLSYEEKKDYIHEMLLSYCQNRHDMYLSHGYSNSTLQVMADNYSHKRNSKTGIKKIIQLLKPLHLSRTSSIKKVINGENCIFLPDGNKNNGKFDSMLDDLKIEMKSRENEHDKIPDIVFCYNKNYYICELKMMKHLGGGQDKQTVEFANFIRYSEKNRKVHYITYLDGILYNSIVCDNNPNINRVRSDIEKCLKNNRQNYFLNTFSFIKFVNDIK